MKKIYEVSKGTQYNANGVLVASGPLYMSLVVDGGKARLDCGHFFREAVEPGALNTAILLTASDGETRIVTIGEDETGSVPLAQGRGPCPKCGTYCEGDCSFG